MPKPTIKITYSDDQPKVELPQGLDVEIQLIKEEPDCFMAYRGVRVYSTVWKDMGAAGMCYSEYRFGLRPDMSSEDEDAFDIREISAYPNNYKPEVPTDIGREWGPDELTLAYAIDKGWIDEDDSHLYQAQAKS